ncbi:MAG: 50S ribosome-binding GTPase, partial [Desulfovibrio sp.]|nr:50S ribosome-binding GTPase [Desulfovibrio sp.]
MGAQDRFLKLVLAGHVDHGKSSVIGRLLYDTRSFPQGAVDKVRRIAGETGKRFEFAYLLDAFEEEQKQGITIDTTRLRFHTAKRGYVIIDAPGHKEFLRNMISGAADADAAFLVVDAARGVEEQSRRHASMLSLLGIRQVCVIANKMDLVDYAEDAYLKVKEDMGAFLETLGLRGGSCIPLSALEGVNVLGGSDKLPWYRGRSLIETLDALAGAPDFEQSVLRLPVQDVYKFDARRIIAGRLESGLLRVGDLVAVYPGGRRTRVESMPFWPGEGKSEAVAGESVGITVADEFFNRRGEVICHVSDPPPVTRVFRASLFWMGKTPLIRGREYKLKIATQAVPARVRDILRVVDAACIDDSHADAAHAGAAPGPARSQAGVTLQRMKGEAGMATGLAREQAGAGDVAEVGVNDVAEVIIAARVPLALDLFSTCRATGRFVLVDGYDVAGGGIVTCIEFEADKFCGFVQGEIKVPCDLFEEYFYSLDEQAVNKHSARAEVYSVGDLLPLRGESFSYPEFFDIVSLPDDAAIRVRSGRIAEILPLAAYRYEGLPLVNGRGFAVRVRSGRDWQRCLGDYSPNA